MAVLVTKLTIAVDFKALAMRNVLSVIVSGVMGIVLAYIGWGVWAIVAQAVVASVINLVFLWIYSKWKPTRPFSRKSFHDMFSYGSKLLASGLINTIYSNLTTLVVGRFFTAKDLGVYNRGTSLPALPIWNINGAFQRVLFPILTRFQNDDEALIGYYRKYISITSLGLFFLGCLMAAVGKPLVLFLLTDKWAECIIYMQIFSFSIMFDHLNIINHTLLLAKGRSDLFLKLELIKKPIFITILLASIPFGVLGICVSKVITSQVAIVINTYYTGKIFKFGYWEQLKDFSPYLLMAILACVPAYLLSFWDIAPIVPLLLGCISAPLLYWLMLRRNACMIEILSLAKHAIRRK